ncbi:MAG TPA: DoxX family protein [Mucilaginibacter sp.]|nr:DoxX family protein [Mucilaginibacter sp.]
MTTVAEPVYWSNTQKIVFRFFMVFFVLYIFFNPNGVLPYSDNLFGIYIEPFHKFIPWMAAHVLHLSKPVTVFTNGSGDTTYDYLTILMLTVISVIAAAIWSVTGRKTRNYNKLFYWLTVVIRYYVAITMIGYGFFKVIKLQFPSPSFGRLLEPVGKMSPMGLAWTYLGYSTGFNYFAGFAEIAVGLLLFFRKTSTLGAILGLVVAGNIMAINYCFDVPVKLLSTFLVLMCIFLLVRDATRLINFFMLNREAKAANLTPHRFKARWKNITLTAAKYLLILYTLFFDLTGALESEKTYGDKAKKPPLYGLYDVDTFVKNRDTLPPLTTDTVRWNKFIINYQDGAQIRMMNDSMTYYAFKPDVKNHTAIANSYADTAAKFHLTYTTPKPDVMELRGTWKKDSIYVRMHKVDPNSFRLMGRGFHWINEYPFNR